MDRATALTLFAMTFVLGAVAVVAWVAPSPFDDFDSMIVPAPGAAPVPFAQVDDPRFSDVGTILHGAMIEGLRKAPLFVAPFALVFGVIAWVRSAHPGSPRRSRLASVYWTLAPLIGAAALGAALFTPPDLVSTLLLSAFQWALYTPLALGLHVVLSKAVRSRHGRSGRPRSPSAPRGRR